MSSKLNNVLDCFNCNKYLSHIFLETLEKIQIDDGDSSHLHIHQEDHDDLDDLDEQLDQGSRINMTYNMSSYYQFNKPKFNSA